MTPSTELTRSVVQILGSSRSDADKLKAWYNAPLSFRVDQAADDSFQADSKEGVLGPDPDGMLFQMAAHLLLTYQYYPPEVMNTLADFDLEQRTMQPGDRILLRIHVLRLGSLNIVDALALNRVVEVREQPREVEIAYATTTRHSEVGIWRANLSRGADDLVRIRVSAESKPAAYVPFPVKWVARSLQKRAWRLGMAHFIRQAQQAALAT